MAFTATTVWEIQIGGGGTGGAAGGFDRGVSGMATDGAATVATSAAPIFSSASYNFVNADIGNFIYIKSGTNWLSGWYIIVSLSGNNAVLNATIGTATLDDSSLNNVTGCATTASPTGATWAIDYSQKSAAYRSYTDLTAAGSGSTFTSAGFPFGVEQVGNMVNVASGTNAVVQRAVIISVSGVTATFDKAVTTGACSNGVGKQGGAIGNIGLAGLLHVAGNWHFIKYNATAFIPTSSTLNISGGRLSVAGASSTQMTYTRGYDVTRGDATGNRPTIQWGVNAGNSYLIVCGQFMEVSNLIADGASASFTGAGGLAFSSAAAPALIYGCKIINCNFHGFGATSAAGQFTILRDTEITACSGGSVITQNGASGLMIIGCYIHDNTNEAFNNSVTASRFEIINTIFDTNKSGSSFAGIVISQTAVKAIILNCVIYNCGTHGMDIQQSTQTMVEIRNTIFESNGGYGVNLSAGAFQQVSMDSVAFYSNTSGKYPAGQIPTRRIVNEIINTTGSFFVDAPNANFALNTIANQGLLAYATGIPSSWPGCSTLSYRDVGAAQHKDPVKYSAYAL